MDVGMTVLLVAAVLIGGPVLGIVGFLKAKRAEARLAALDVRLRALEAAAHAAPNPTPRPEETEDQGGQSKPPSPPEAVATPAPSAPPPEPAPPIWSGSAVLPGASASTTFRGGRGASEHKARRAPRLQEWNLTQNWLVWLGGVTLFLGGAFLVKFSIDQGWLSPAVRVGLGMLVGLVAIGVGHRLSRPYTPEDAARWQVPQVLAGAGAGILFAAVYAAYGLYDLIGPLPAFAGLALVSAASVLLAVRHGPFVALLGLVGALVVPLLVRTDSENAVALFAYLMVVAAGAMALLRWRQWVWLGWVALGGPIVWIVLWLLGPFAAGDEGVLGVALTLLFGLAVALRTGMPVPAVLSGSLETPQTLHVVRNAAVVTSLAAWGVIVAADWSPLSLVLPCVLGVAFLVLAWKQETFDTLPPIGGLLLVAVLASWRPETQVVGWGLVSPRPPMPAEPFRFLGTAILGALLYGLWGLGGALLRRHAGRWAAVSVSVPLLTLAVAFWRLKVSLPDWGWTMSALGLAALLVWAADLVSRYRPDEARRSAVALAAYAVGVLGAVALAVTFLLEQAWLSVALAALLPAAAWVEGRLRLSDQGEPRLRQACLILSGIVLVRLIANPYVLDYPLGTPFLGTWIVYGYGGPAIAFALAAWLFRRQRDDHVVAVLEAGAMVFLSVLVTLVIRTQMAGGLAPSGPYSLAEHGVRTVGWLALAVVFLIGYRRSARPMLLWGGRVLLVLGGGHAVFVQGMSAVNPFLSGAPVGETPVLNLLLILYAVPALLLGAASWLLNTTGQGRSASGRDGDLARIGGASALALGLLWMTMEVRHIFVGPVLTHGPAGPIELWAYSAAWLVAAVGVLVAGVRLRVPILRLVGLGLLLLVVAKVFLVDLSRTDGLWRALSFLGLGVALVGVGWLYRRFVAESPKDTAENAHDSP